MNASPIRHSAPYRSVPALALLLTLLVGSVVPAYAQPSDRAADRPLVLPDTVRAERVHSHTLHTDVQRVEVAVTPSGYAPSVVVLQAGVPAELIFTRPTDAGCGDELHVPDLGVEKTALPPGEAVTIRLTPEEPGTYPFLCGMNMLRGELLVE